MEINKQEGFEDINTKLNVKKFHCQCGIQHTEDQLIKLQEDIYCETCLQKQLEIEKSQILKLEEAYIFYKEYEGSISQNDIASLKKQMLNNDENQQLTKQQQQLQKTLEELKKKQKEALIEMENLKSRVLELDKEEGRYWEEMNKFEKKLYKLQEKTNTARWESRVAQEEYERLAGFSVINQVFKITCQGEVALINGLALGKRPRARDVDWEEVNAALGHLFLLFCFLVLKHQYTCVRLTDRECLGSYSKVRIRDKVYQISYNKDKEKEFGEVMDELLIEFQSFHQQLKKQSSTQIELPYKISIGQYKIEGLYINPGRIKTAKWDTWSKSMKYFLTNFEYIAVNHSLADKLI